MTDQQAETGAAGAALTTTTGADGAVSTTAAPTGQQPTKPEPQDPQTPEGTDPAGDATGGDPAAGEPKKKKGGYQRQIEKLERDNYLLAHQNRQFQTRFEQMEKEKGQPQQPAAKPAETTANDEPKVEQFTTVDEFVASHREWAKKQGMSEGIAEGRRLAQTELQQEQEQKRLTNLKAAMNLREAQAKTKFKDFDEVVQPFGGILMSGNPVLADFIATEDMGMEVAYHLAQNPAVLDEVLGMSGFAAHRKLLDIEARLKAPPPPKPVTNAPDPIKPTGAAETVVKTLSDLAQQEDAGDYIKKANQARARKT